MSNTNIPEILLNDFRDIGETVNIKSHETLISVGQKVSDVYVVLNGGIVMLHVHPDTGKERAINFFIPDFHPMATVAESFYLDKTSEYHLKTFTNSTLIKIRKDRLMTFLSSSDHAEYLHDHGIRNLLEKNSMRAKLISLDSFEMLQYLHNKYPQILQKVPSKYIANFLGISPQWLSKLKHKL